MNNVVPGGCGRWSLSPFVVPRKLAGRHATPGQTPAGKAVCRQGEIDVTLSHNMPPATVGVQVELFSMARLVCGRSLLVLDLPRDATLADVAQALVRAC